MKLYLNDLKGFDQVLKTHNGPYIMQPYVMLRTLSDVTKVGEEARLDPVMVPVWLQYFEQQPEEEKLLDMLLNSRAAQHQKLVEWNQLPVIRRGNFCYYQPQIIGIKQIIELGLPDSDEEGIEHFCQAIHTGVRIGIWPHSLKAAREFIEHPTLP